MTTKSYTVATADQLGGRTAMCRVKPVIAGQIESNKLPRRSSSTSGRQRQPRANRDRTQSGAKILPQPKTKEQVQRLATSSRLPEKSSPVRVVEELVLTTEQLAELVNAFTKSPLIKSTLSCERLQFPATESKASSSHPALYSLPNRQFIDRNALRIDPEMCLVNGRACGAALIDAEDEVRYTSCPTKALKEGHRTQLELLPDVPYAVKIHTQLCEHGKQGDVVLQLVVAAIDRLTGRRGCFLSLEEDVSTSVVRATLAEVARMNGLPPQNIKVISKARPVSDRLEALVDELQASCEYADIAESSVKAMQSLSASTCAMQTLTLMSEISKIKAASQDFVVLKPGGYDEHGATTVLCSTISHGLHQSLKAAGQGQEFLKTVVGAVQYCSQAKEEFMISDPSGLNTYFRCIPLFETTHQKPQAWAVFVEPRARRLQLLRKR